LDVGDRDAGGHNEGGASKQSHGRKQSGPGQPITGTGSAGKQMTERRGPSK